MSAQHTAGPWTLCRTISCGDTIEWRIAGAKYGSSRPVCNAGLSDRIDEGELEANGRRIVACVNACEGVDTETLEQAISIGLVRQVRLRIAAEKQRDQLLEALLIALPFVEDAIGSDDFKKGIVQKAANTIRAAIAAAEVGE